jgi:hypothetical protein
MKFTEYSRFANPKGSVPRPFSGDSPRGAPRFSNEPTRVVPTAFMRRFTQCDQLLAMFSWASFDR